MNRIIIALGSVALLVAAAAAQAAPKAYTSDPDKGGVAGDFILNAPQNSPIAETDAGVLGGFARLTDDNLGSVTLNELVITQDRIVDIDSTFAFGPGSFIFIDVRNTNGPAPNQVGVGGTDPTESVAWGILSGWDPTGFNFCISSPVTTCNLNGFLHGMTFPTQPTSSTFDIGTWAFDAAGDYEATAPYINRINNGGLSNNTSLLRGTFVGASLPALPLVGFGALAIGLAAVGARTLVRKR